MPIDSSIYFQNKGIDFGKVLDSYNEGVRMSDLAKDRAIKDREQKKQKGMSDAIASSFTKDPTGNLVFNRNSTSMQNLIDQGFGDQVPELQSKLDAYQMAEEDRNSNSARSQYYRSEAKKYGINLPEDTSAFQMKGLFDPQKALEQDLKIKGQIDLARIKSNGGKSSGGKLLPAGAVENLSSSEAATRMIKNLSTQLEGMKDFNPYGGLNPKRYIKGTDAKNKIDSYDAGLMSTAQMVGKFLEGGKLTDVDFAKYKNMLPAYDDTSEVKKAKIAQIQKMIDEKQSTDSSYYQKAGYDASQFQKPKTIRMIDPKGRKIEIPESQKGEAIAAGARVK